MACAAVSVSLVHGVPSYTVLQGADHNDSYCYNLHPVLFGVGA